MSVCKSDETLLSICILNFSFKNDFVWEEISNIRHSVSSPDETPWSSSKILRCAWYFQLSSRCFIWCWNTASHVWYITYCIMCFVEPQKGVHLGRGTKRSFKGTISAGIQPVLSWADQKGRIHNQEKLYCKYLFIPMLKKFMID